MERLRDDLKLSTKVSYWFKMERLRDDLKLSTKVSYWFKKERLSDDSKDFNIALCEGGGESILLYECGNGIYREL